MKTYVAFVRDHSGSMVTIKNGAMKDFNLMVESIKASKKDLPYHDILATVVKCGFGYDGKVQLSEVGQPIEQIQSLTIYDTSGGRTPLWDSVITAIEKLKSVDRVVGHFGIAEQKAFLVIVTTDGCNNVNDYLLTNLVKKIRDLQATDLWTFVFRVPVGQKRYIVNMGIPEGNVVEWEQTMAGQAAATVVTTAAITNYFTEVNRGVTATKKFYTTDLSAVSISEVKKDLDDVTNDVDVKRVWTGDDDIQIRDFCEKSFGEYVKGRAYYELTKPETVQESKNIILKHLKKGRYFTGGYEVRKLLGLPISGSVRIHPGDHGDFEIYVQSTSVNRKLKKNTNVLYWK